tara:strand:- start:200 stop:631 length:432 start_codon:yes stop_codon:yes gene_type:complete
MAEVTKNRELEHVVISGISPNQYRPYSTHFDQRRVNGDLGVDVNWVGAETYSAQGSLGIADYWPIFLNAVGTISGFIEAGAHAIRSMQVYQSGTVLLEVNSCKSSNRTQMVNSAAVTSSGDCQLYVVLEGRSPSLYDINLTCN